MGLGRSSAALAALLLFASAPSGAMAQNLVTNGGFETGDFSGWIHSGNTGASGVTSSSSFVHSGTYGAQLGPVGSDGYLSQNLATTVGDTYTVSFWLDMTGGTPNDFSASFAGNSLMSLSNSTAFGWNEYSHAFTASASTSTLLFSFRQDPSYWGLDDITVTPNSAPASVPGSGLLSLAFFALAGVGTFARGRLKSAG